MGSIGKTALLFSLVFFGSSLGTQAQEALNDPYNIATPPGTAILHVQSALWAPVWCDEKTIAFQRETILEEGAKRWIEYHTLGESKFETERLTEEGGLVACSPGGAERVMQRDGDYGGIGQLVLVRTSDRREVELSARARLVSADRALRTFIFENAVLSRGEPSTFELTSMKNNEGDFPQSKPRTTAIFASQYEAIQAAALSSDGTTLAYTTRGMFYADPRRWAPSIGLSLLRAGQLKAGRARLDEVINEEMRLESLFFNGEKLVLAGASIDGELIIAICSVDPEMRALCRTLLTGLNSSDFRVVGLGTKDLPIIASAFQQVGQNGLRACLFELSEGNKSVAPQRCRTIAPPKPTYGMGPDQFYSIAPDRRHVAVLTRYRSSQDAPSPDEPTWAIVPMSEFEKN